MPFDNPAPDLSQPSLKGLSYILRHQETWPPGFEWNYASAHSCAIGLSAKRWSVAHTFLGEKMGRLRFERTFLSHGYRPTKDANVTPEMVADRIDSFLRG